MATTLSHLIVKLDADIGNLQKKMTAAERAVDNMADKATRAGKALTVGVSVPLAAVAGFAVSAAADLDRLRRGLTAVTGSAEETERQMVRLREVARLPGLGFKEAIQGSIALQALSFEAAKAERILIAFGNAIATTGGGKQELDRVITQLGQMASTGRVLTQDLRPIIQISPLVAKAMKQAFGTVSAEEINKLGLSAEEFIETLVGQLEKLPKVSGGAANAFENLSDSLFRARAAIGEKLLPVVIPLIDGLASMLEGIEELNPATVRMGIAMGAVAAAAGPLLFVLGAVTKAFIALKIAGIAALPVLGPAGLLIAGLSGLAAILVKIKLDTMAAASELDNAAEAADRFSRALDGITEAQAKARIADIEQQLENLRLIQDQMNAGTVGPGVGMALGAGFGVDGVAAEIERLEDLLESLEARIGGGGDGVISGLTAQVDTAGLEFGRVIDHVGSLRDKLTGLRHDAAFAATTEDAAKLRQEIESTATALERAATAAQRMFTAALARMPDPVARMADSLGVAADAVGNMRRDMEGAARLSARLRFGQRRPKPDLPEPKGGVLDSVLTPLKSLGPQALALGAVFEMLKGVMEPLQPVLDTLKEPLRQIGHLFGLVLAPVVELLAISMTGLMKGVSYVIQGFGWFIEAIGWLIDKLVGWFTDWGDKLQDWGKDLQSSAKRMRESQEDAADAADRLASGLTNAVRGFKASQYRFGSTDAGSGSTASPAVASASVGDIIINTTGEGAETYRNWYDELDQRTRGADPAARALFHALPAPA